MPLFPRFRTRSRFTHVSWASWRSGRSPHQPDARPECLLEGEQAVWPYGESDSAFTILTGVGRRLIAGSFSTVAIVLSSSSCTGDCKGGRIRDDAAATAARAARIWKSDPANVTSFLV